MTFENNLRTYRKENDWTQQELAEKIGVSQKAISSWEIGRTEPTIKDVIELCKVFDCTIEQLTGTRPRAIGEITFEDILVKLNDLSIDELGELYKRVGEVYNLKQEIADLQIAKEKQEKQLLEFERRIQELQRGIGGGLNA